MRDTWSTIIWVLMVLKHTNKVQNEALPHRRFASASAVPSGVVWAKCVPGAGSRAFVELHQLLILQLLVFLVHCEV